ncbi:uncharacterized protein [Drosophila kikkawai]|uniref:Uncharacterized protein isoform X2 n=1 Tax=Drosophila kikkawai TaxID=30033 RepID=A0ABM3C7K0_DROKI|nr:uncharacterized protein LOC108076155 [Drosophila kikkawai]
MAGPSLIQRKPKKLRKRLGKPLRNFKLDLDGLINMLNTLKNKLKCQKNLRLCFGDDSPVKKTKQVDDAILFEKFHRMADELVSDDEDLLENCHRLAEKFARLKVKKSDDVAGLCEKELVRVTETFETPKLNKGSQPDSKTEEDVNLMDISFVSLNLGGDENEEFFKACQRSAKKIEVTNGFKESQEDSENKENENKIDKLELPFKPMEKNQIVKKTPQKIEGKTEKLQTTEKIEIVPKPLQIDIVPKQLEINTEDAEIVPKPLENQELKQYKVQKNPQVQRKLEFLRNSPTKNLELPPKIFTPQTATNQEMTGNNEDIEEGEIINDDCVLLEPPNVPINNDGDKSQPDTKPISTEKGFEASLTIENNCDSVIPLKDSIGGEIVTMQKDKGNRKSDKPVETIGHPNWNKRNIIIDGSNVAFAHGRSTCFSSEGLQYCLQYFSRMGHDVRAVVPLFRRNAFQSSNPQLLDQLYKGGKIWFTPCKNFYGHKSVSYDDRLPTREMRPWSPMTTTET